MLRLRPPSTLKLLLETRSIAEWAGGWLMPTGWTGRSATKRGAVLLLPGLLTNGWSMRLLGARLTAAGFTVHHWSGDFNLGPRPGVIGDVISEVRRLHKVSGHPIHLVGWSMGGCLAVATAARAPEAVGRVVVMGAPLAAETDASHLGIAFRLASGARGTRRQLLRLLGQPQTMVHAIVSVDDGLLDWRGCVPTNLPRSRIRWLRGISHLGMPAHPVVAVAVIEALGVRRAWPAWAQWFKTKAPH